MISRRGSLALIGAAVLAACAKKAPIPMAPDASKAFLATNAKAPRASRESPFQGAECPIEN